MAKPSITSDFASEMVAAMLWQRLTSPAFPDEPSPDSSQRLLSPEMQEVQNAMQRRAEAAECEAQRDEWLAKMRALADVELARPRRNIERALAKLPPDDPQRRWAWQEPDRFLHLRTIVRLVRAFAAEQKMARIAHQRTLILVLKQFASRRQAEAAQHEALRVKRLRELGARGGAAAAAARRKYAPPELVRAIAADIDSISGRLSTRKRYNLIRRKIILAGHIYPIPRRFSRWLKTILKKMSTSSGGR
jgi:hypothetical protein